MKIQRIESSNSINHKAKFINDKNGYFRKLWQDAVLDVELAEMIDKFSKKNKKHSIEIIDASYNNNTKNFTYNLFNHFNGFGITIESHNIRGFVLHEILEKIFNSQLLTEKNSRTATLYQKLTGQNNSIFNKIFKG